jgi:hypothetical protein
LSKQVLIKVIEENLETNYAYLSDTNVVIAWLFVQASFFPVKLFLLF